MEGKKPAAEPNAPSAADYDYEDISYSSGDDSKSSVAETNAMHGSLSSLSTSMGDFAAPPPRPSFSRSQSASAIPFKLSALQHDARQPRSLSTTGVPSANGTFFEKIPTRLLKLNLKAPADLSQEKEVMLDGDYQLKPNDVLCGGNKKGSSSKESSQHPGNERFRILIQTHVERYRKAATRNDKTQLVRQVVQMVRQSGGKFVQKKGGYWQDIGNKKARDKAGHALRAAANRAGPTTMPVASTQTAAAAAAVTFAVASAVQQSNQKAAATLAATSTVAATVQQMDGDAPLPARRLGSDQQSTSIQKRNSLHLGSIPDFSDLSSLAMEWSDHLTIEKSNEVSAFPRSKDDANDAR